MPEGLPLFLFVVDHVLRHRGLRPLGHVEIAVDIQTGTGGDQLADDDVLLQADQVINLALDCRFRQNRK